MIIFFFFHSLNTPPGTKLRFKPGVIPVVHGMVQLRPNLLEFLGGRVAPLVEKWELNRVCLNFYIFSF